MCSSVNILSLQLNGKFKLANKTQIIPTMLFKALEIKVDGTILMHKYTIWINVGTIL